MNISKYIKLPQEISDQKVVQYFKKWNILDFFKKQPKFQKHIIFTENDIVYDHVVNSFGSLCYVESYLRLRKVKDD